MQSYNNSWTTVQKKIVLASFLGWCLDAFDFFLLVFVLKDIAKEFGTHIDKVAIAITLTLAMRPLGALIFGRIADHFGRRPALMIDVALFSILEFLTAFSPNLTVFIILRILFGIAMGGEWGVGAALTMESIPVKSRGLISGMLQAGYPMGYLLASIVFGLLYNCIGWRGMFILGALPALLVLYIREHIPESAAWQTMQTATPKENIVTVLAKHWRLSLYVILLMMGFNFFSHGSQDLYPTFLQIQHGFDTHTVGLIAVTYNIGAILGGIFFGTLSEYIGRRYAIILAALLALPLIPVWAYSHTAVMLAVGAFLMQFAVQGAWGVVPVHLNELSPGAIRATFPALMYQLGNLLASVNAIMQTYLAAKNNNNYSLVLSLTIGIVAVFLILMAFIGPERRSVTMAEN